MVTVNGNDRHRSSSGRAPGKDAIAPEIPGGLPHMVTCDGSQPGLDDRTPLLAPWVAAAMASGPPAFVNRMVRRRIPARHSAPNVFHRRVNR
jgi:hypothetical protein